MTVAEEYHVKRIEKIIRMTVPREPIPTGVEVLETPFDEQQDMLREIDEQRKKDDPTFAGAFHEKKMKPGVSIKAKGPGHARSAEAKKLAAKSGAATARPRPTGAGRPKSNTRRPGGSKPGGARGGKR